MKGIAVWKQAVNKRLESLERENEQMTKRISRAFPGGDEEGHRVYHEGIKERNVELRRLRMAIQEKTISGLIWSFMVWACFQLWHALLAQMGRP